MENNTTLITIDEITAIVMEALGSIVNPGANGEAPRLDLNQVSPAPLFVGALVALCESYTQLHSTKEHQADYLQAMAAMQELFTRYLVDKNIDHVIAQLQAQSIEQAEQVEAEIVK